MRFKEGEVRDLPSLSRDRDEVGEQGPVGKSSAVREGWAEVGLPSASITEPLPPSPFPQAREEGLQSCSALAGSTGGSGTAREGAPLTLPLRHG